MFNQKSWIDQANELVRISTLLTSFGIYVPESVNNGGSKKVHCPFGIYHSDNGLSKAMRVYGASNTAYCFSCSKRYSPVSLAAAQWDCSWVNAALRLLDEAGFKPKSWQERWEDAVAPPQIIDIDTLSLAEALKIYCSSIDASWNMTQLDGSAAEMLDKCLSLLPTVKTSTDAEKWLTTCKAVMRKVLL